MAQPRMRTCKPPKTRQNATYHVNAFGLSDTDLKEVLDSYPAPEWMGTKAKELWATAIRAYHPGQFHRYNLPMLEQWVIMVLNIRKLTRLLGQGGFMCRPQVTIGDNGETVTTYKSTSEFHHYRNMVMLMSRMELALHMTPRPYVVMSPAESETLDETIRHSMESDVEVDANNQPIYKPGNRLALLGGRSQSVN